MVEEFQKLCVEEYNEEIKDDDASELAQNLLNVYRIVYRKPPESADFVLNRAEKCLDDELNDGQKGQEINNLPF